MSDMIENRVVEMQFNNQQFERNVKTSTESLEKLNKSINKGTMASSLSSLKSAVSGIDLSGLTNGIDQITSKFSALGIMGVRTLQNIADTVYQTGVSFVKSLTIDPISSGLSEYNTQINATQTILANTSKDGKTIDDVNASLNELNTYADKTIYNFTEMTRNIGTFTAAGVKLEDATASIKGISNLAAISGSTSQQASTAMYQLSQALSSGTVKLQDWNSVVNAGMGGKIFQDELVSTANHSANLTKAQKKILKDIKAGKTTFRESLQKGWLTSDILQDTLAKFTGDVSEKELEALGYTEDEIKEIIKLGQMANDAATKVKTLDQLLDTLKEAAQSGWTQTWQLIAGDFEEAKELWTSISDRLGGIIGASADARNGLLKIWKQAGGRKLLIESFWNLFDSIQNVAKLVKETFSEFFPPATWQDLFNITKVFRDFTAKIKDATSFVEEFKTVWDENGNQGTFTERLEKTGVKMSPVMEKLQQAIRGVAAAFKVVWDIGAGVWRVFSHVVELLGPHLLDLMAKLGNKVTTFCGQLDINGIFDLLIEGIDWLYEKAVKYLPPIVDEIKEFLNSFKQSDFFVSTIQPIIDSVKGFIHTLSGASDELEQADTTGAVGQIRTFFSGISDSLGQFKDKMKPIIQKIKDLNLPGLLVMVVLAFGAFKLYKLIANVSGAVTGLVKGVTKAVGGVTEALDSIGSSIKEFGKSQKAAKWFSRGSTVLMIAGAVWIIADAISKVGKMRRQDIAKGTGAILLILGALFAFMKFGSTTTDLTNLKAFERKFSGVKMMELGVTIMMFADSVCKIGLMSLADVAKGTAALLVILGALFAFMKFGTTTTDLTNLKAFQKRFSGTEMLMLGATIMMFADSICKIGQMRWQNVVKGVAALIVVLGGLMAFMKWGSSKVGSQMADMGVLMGLGDVLKKIADVIVSIGQLSIDQLMTGVAGFGAIVAGLIVLIKEIGTTSTFSEQAKGFMSLMGVGIAVWLLGKTLQNLAQLSWEQISKGVTALGFVMLMLIAFVNNATTETDVKSASGFKLIGLGIAVWLFAQTIKGLGDLSWQQIAQGVTALGVIVAMLIAFINNTTMDKDTKTAGGFKLIGLGMAVWLFAQTIKGLGDLSWDQIVKGLSALTMVVVMLIAFLNNTTMDKDTKAVGGFKLIGLGVAVWLFAQSIQGLGDMRWEDMLKGVAGIGAILVEIGLFTKYAGSMKVSSLLSIIPMIVAVVAFAYALTVIKDIDWHLVAAFGVGMGAFLISAAGFMGIVGKLTPGEIAKGVAAVTALVAALSLVAVAISGLVASAIENMANKLYGMSLSIKLISDAGKKVKPKYIKNVAEAFEMLAQMMGNVTFELGGTGNYDAVAGKMVDLSEKLALFSENITTDVASKFGKAKTASEKLKDIYTNLSGITDIGNYESVATSIGNIGGAMALFSGEVGGVSINDDAEAQAGKIADLLSAVSKALAGSDMITTISDYADESSGDNLTKFSIGLEALTTALNDYATNAGSINTDNMDKVSTSLGKIADLKAKLDENKTIIDQFITWTKGEDRLGTFAESLISLGSGVKKYSDNVKQVNTEKLGNVSLVLDSLVSIKNRLETGTTSLWSWITGTSLDTFGAQIGKLGGYFGTFYEGTSKIAPNNKNMNGVIRLIDTLVLMQLKLSAGTTYGGQQLDSLAFNLQDIAGALNEAKGEIDQLGEGDLSKWQTVAEVAHGIGLLYGALKGLDGETPSVEGIQGLVNALGSMTIPDFNVSGGESAKAFFTGIVDGLQDSVSIDNMKQKATVLGEDVGTSAKDGLRTKWGDWYDAGSYLVDGLISGMQGKMTALINAGTAIADLPLGQIKLVWDEHSPSKEFAKVGEYGVEGLIQGLQTHATELTAAGGDTAQEAVNSAKSMLSGISQIVTDDIDAAPVITPVLDLSNIQSKAGAIGSLFGTQTIRTNGINANSAKQATAAMTTIRKPENNTQILNSIEAATQRLNALGEAMTNMDMVLDTGMLVGQLQGRIDRKLGYSSALRGRGRV